METSSAQACLYCMFTCVGLSVFPYACMYCMYPFIEETCTELTRAIEAGDMQSASVIAATLARQHAALKIQPFTRDYEDTEIK